MARNAFYGSILTCWISALCMNVGQSMNVGRDIVCQAENHKQCKCTLQGVGKNELGFFRRKECSVVIKKERGRSLCFKQKQPR